jgi:mannose/cellobiose epimerase-like protein (N-acyl-D-glucosamine 2-epimerase family)
MSTSAPVPGDAAYLAAEREHLLGFAEGSRHPLGFGWLDERGRIDPSHPVELYVTCRMTHVMSLGVLLGRTGAAALAEHGVEALDGPLRDLGQGGWFPAVTDDGPEGTAKGAYGHAFVVLAASSASAAGIPGASALLDAALAVSEERFWDDAAGMVVEEWDRGWHHLDPYRGMNANMHTVEAYLAAADVTGDRRWAQRAGRIAARLVMHAEGNGWRIPEHYDSAWRPLPDYNREVPAHPFRPFGATVGHALEWSRLLIGVEATLGRLREPVPVSDTGTGLPDAAVALFARAVADGWAADGAEGFVYTTDWDGAPVVRARMHWVLAEAVGAAATLHRVTDEPSYEEHYRRWWGYADRYLVDRDGGGSWHHELDAENRPAATVWPGKPDVYHAFQATLLPLLPPEPTLGVALTPAVVAQLDSAGRHGARRAPS